MRRRSRSRGSNLLPWTGLATIAVVLAVAFGGGPAATAFTTGNVDRNSAVDVVTDPEAALGVDSASAVYINTTSTLVNTTNRLDREATVTVSLRGSSADYADLVVNGNNEGDSVSLTLTEAETRTIDVAIPDNSSLVGQSVRFDVRASAPGLQVETNNRSAPIEG